MTWQIKCSDANCGRETLASNIVDLISAHLDNDGWFLCRQCRQHGYIKRSFKLQEKGQTWEPFLRGIVPLGETGDTYQPFVFLVSNTSDGPPNNLWFSYYKDLRASGGRLKLGYGPGGPPVLDIDSVLRLLRQLTNIGCLSRKEIETALTALNENL